MPKQPLLWTLEDKPQQRLYAVRRTDFADIFTRATSAINADDKQIHLPKRISPEAQLVCGAEWAWSPMNNRICNFHLHRGRKHYYLWRSFFMDHEYPWRWCHEIVTYVPRSDDALEIIASGLLARAWLDEIEDVDLDEPHWYSATGLLGVAALKAVEAFAWSDAARELQ
jgi:hypothetical protein